MPLKASGFNFEQDWSYFVQLEAAEDLGVILPPPGVYLTYPKTILSSDAFTVHLHRAQVTYELTPNAPIWPRSLNTDIGGTAGNIYLIVNDLGSPSGRGLDFINGYRFLERFYSIYDTTNKRVGFATTSYTKAVTN